MFGRTPVNIHVDDLVHIAWSHDVEGTAVHPVALLDQRQPTQLQVQRPPLHGAAAAKGRRAGGGGCMGAAASGGGGVRVGGRGGAGRSCTAAGECSICRAICITHTKNAHQGLGLEAQS